LIHDRGGEVFKIVPDGPTATCPIAVPAISQRGLAAAALALLAVASLAIRPACPRRLPAWPGSGYQLCSIAPALHAVWQLTSSLPHAA
jgi:hypothetical protein